MNFLVVGDIFGRPGRAVLKKVLPRLQAEHQIDFTIVNGENSAHGKGINPKTFTEILEAGADFVTTGNHIWRHKAIYPILDDPTQPIVRPANFPHQNPGDGHRLVTLPSGKKVLVINLMGRVFMREQLNDPFQLADQILTEYQPHNPDAIIIDFHAETTAEKQAFANYLDGRVTAVCGTHTHVPTADARLLPGGTAYITDIGMTGVYDSIIGSQKDPIIKQFTTQISSKHLVADHEMAVLYAVKITTQPGTLTAQSIELISAK